VCLSVTCRYCIKTVERIRLVWHIVFPRLIVRSIIRKLAPKYGYSLWNLAQTLDLELCHGPSTVLNLVTSHKFITLSVHLRVQRDGHDVARRAGSSAGAETCQPTNAQTLLHCRKTISNKRVSTAFTFLILHQVVQQIDNP